MNLLLASYLLLIFLVAALLAVLEDDADDPRFP